MMDQTIVIGDIEEMNIFDDIKMNQENEEKSKDEDTITFKHNEFQQFVDNLKLKHRAEIDAIMIEQATYQRIIKQMVTKFKNMQKVIDFKDQQIISAKKFEI